MPRIHQIDLYLEEMQEEYPDPLYFYIDKRHQYELEDKTPENPDLWQGWNSFWVRRLAYLILKKEGKL